MKTCTVCKTEQPLDNYYNHKSSVDGKQYRCKSCDNIARKKWQDNNPEKAARSGRERRLRHRYGVDLVWYEDKLKEQGGKCDICGVSQNKTSGDTKDNLNFAVDHNHDTGKVRGLLCNQCNRAMGMLGDDVSTLTKAIQYLGKYDTH